MPKPKITPKAAEELFGGAREGERFTENGDHRLSWDGPCMCPPEGMAVVAEEPDGKMWFCTGEPGDPITDTTEWIGPY